MQGQAYLRFVHSKNRKLLQNVKRSERKLGFTCNSSFCRKVNSDLVIRLLKTNAEHCLKDFGAT